MNFLCLILLEVILTAADCAWFSVTQTPKEVTVNRWTDVTFYCKFTISPHSSKPEVIWWKQIGNERFQTSARKRFGFANESTAFCNILSVTVQDSGVYYCAVIYQGIGQINGTGSHLFVHVAPVPLKITSKLDKENSPASLTLLCETSAFYPEDFTLVWYKNGTETTVGIKTTEVQNSKGLYEVTSSLFESQPPPDNTRYTCSVSHASLKTPATVVHTISTFAGVQKDNTNNSLVFWIPICAVVGFAFLVLIAVIARGHRFQSNKSKEGRARQLDRQDNVETAAQGAQYDAVAFSRDKKAPRRTFEVERTNYAEVRQDAVADEVPYCAVTLTSSKKPEKYHRPKNGTEYAPLQTGRPKEVR